VATKYPNVTRRHFEARGVQAECVKLNGAMEIAPVLGLSSRIVDLVSSGRTLAENGLVEVETIAQVSARLIVNRAAFKTRARDVLPLIEGFREAAGVSRAA
jgi:ATP phosphoribosyltransferase